MKQTNHGEWVRSSSTPNKAEEAFAHLASEYNDADWMDYYNLGIWKGWI